MSVAEAGSKDEKPAEPVLTHPGGSERPLILHLLVGFTVGGAEQQLLGLLPRLRGYGYDQLVCGLKGWGPMGEEFRSLSIPVRALGGRGRADAAVLPRLHGLLRRIRPAILHCYTSRANWAGALAGRMARVPAILLSDREIRTWMRPWQRLLDRCVFALSQGMVVPSRAIKAFDEERVGLPAHRIWVVPNGVDASAFEAPEDGGAVRDDLGLDRNVPVVGYIGRLEEPVKGLGPLLEAVRMLRADGTRCVLSVFGEGPWEEGLRRKTEALGLEGAVRIHGLRRDVPRVMKALDLLVLPSLREGCPNVLLEAMASGLPVLATRVGGVVEMVEHGVTGWLVPPDDPGALAQGMRSLLEDRERSLRMAQEARAWVRAHRTMEGTAEALARIYDGLLRRRARPPSAEEGAP